MKVPGPGDKAETSLVFERLGNCYYSGVPGHELLRQSYFQVLRKAVVAMHGAGLVHLDLFVSNILFTVNADRTAVESLRIVDLDTVHSVGETLSTEIRAGAVSRRFWPSNDVAEPVLDWWHVLAIEAMGPSVLPMERASPQYAGELNSWTKEWFGTYGKNHRERVKAAFDKLGGGEHIVLPADFAAEFGAEFGAV